MTRCLLHAVYHVHNIHISKQYISQSTLHIHLINTPYTHTYFHLFVYYRYGQCDEGHAGRPDRKDDGTIREELRRHGR